MGTRGAMSDSITTGMRMQTRTLMVSWKETWKMVQMIGNFRVHATRDRSRTAAVFCFAARRSSDIMRTCAALGDPELASCAVILELP